MPITCVHSRGYALSPKRAVHSKCVSKSILHFNVTTHKPYFLAWCLPCKAPGKTPSERALK